VQQRLPSLLDPPIMFAHRGARAHSPENTLEAFELGLRLGASGLESDVWLTADGEAVLDHDGVIRARLRKRPIGELRRVQLPSHIPTLAELLEHCGTGFHLSLDLKDPDATGAVFATVRNADETMLERLWLCDWDLPRTIARRAAFPDVRIVDSTRVSRIKEGPERRAATLAEHGVDAVNLRRDDWTGGLSALFHRFERVAFGWDLQLDYQLAEGLRMGLDGVFSDHVDVMRAVFDLEVGG
jgi:glycerophosphoryl diester phosphodiesterase